MDAALARRLAIEWAAEADTAKADATEASVGGMTAGVGGDCVADAALARAISQLRGT